MNILLNISGYFDLVIYYSNGNIVGQHKDQDILEGILDNLQQGEYLISMHNKTISDINDLQTVLYTFEIEPTDSVEYTFEEE